MQSTTPEFWWAIGISSIVIIAIGIAYVLSLVIHQKKRIAEQQQQQERLHRLSAHLQSVREEERLRIAREIHDELGQGLTVAKIYLTVLQNNVLSGSTITGSDVRRRLDSAIAIIDDSISKVKDIAYELRPIVLDDLGLKEAIEWKEKKFQTSTGIHCTIQSTDQHVRIEKKRAAAVFRIFQEALTNVARHANASLVDIRVKLETDDMVLEITDNGKGIEESELQKVKSLGILGMKERAQFLRGSISIGSLNGTGTRVMLTVPLRGKKNGGRKKM